MSAQRIAGRQIVCVGFADWETELWTNQHHLMHRLAADNEVLFVESLGLRRPTLAARDLSRLLRRLHTGLRPPRTLDGVHVLSPLLIPMHSSTLVRSANTLLLRALVERACTRLRFERPILWAYVPQAEVLLQALKPSLVVYHCVDDIAAQERIDTASFRAAEERFARRADLVLASARPLVDRLESIAENVLYAPNVADVQLFATALQQGDADPAMLSLPRPRILFVGAIVQSKLDFELILSLAALRREWSFALVGPVGPGDPSTDVSELAAAPNIHLLGHRPHHMLPQVMRAADAAIIPYANNQLTASVFPMKVYEQLAAGLPVIATPLPSLQGLPDVALGSDAQCICAAIERALASDSDETRRGRSQRAAQHSWDARLAQIGEAIAAIEGGRER